MLATFNESELFHRYFSRNFITGAEKLQGKTPVCRTSLDGWFFSSYSGVIPKKGITKKFVEVFAKDRNSSRKVTNKFRLLKQIKVFFDWEEV